MNNRNEGTMKTILSILVFCLATVSWGQDSLADLTRSHEKSLLELKLKFERSNESMKKNFGNSSLT